MNVFYVLKACRDIFQSENTATKEQRQTVERACNDNNTNLKVLNCVREIMDVTPIENSKQCKCFFFIFFIFVRFNVC